MTENHYEELKTLMKQLYPGDKAEITIARMFGTIMAYITPEQIDEIKEHLQRRIEEK